MGTQNECDFHRVFSEINRSLRDKKLDREVPGTGLGLTLSQTIIQNLGGRAGLESEVNKGSTFWFVVPLIMNREYN